MPSHLFGVTGREVQLVLSSARLVRLFRTELVVQLWDGRKTWNSAVALWDSGADFFTVSEQFADQSGIAWRHQPEQLGSSGTGGSQSGVLVPLVIRLVRLRHIAFRVECQVLIGATFARPLLGNRFVRRNFNVETRGERRTYFRLRHPAPDAIPPTPLHTP